MFINLCLCIVYISTYNVQNVSTIFPRNKKKDKMKRKIMCIYNLLGVYHFIYSHLKLKYGTQTRQNKTNGHLI